MRKAITEWNEPVPAALYARVSSDRKDVDLSVSAQLRALRDCVDKNGYSFVREYVDDAESGRIADRPQFRRMLDQAIAAESAAEREAILTDLDNSMAWYKMSVGSGGLLAQCFECMQVCPIAIAAPQADPIRRASLARGKSPEGS